MKRTVVSFAVGLVVAALTLGVAAQAAVAADDPTAPTRVLTNFSNYQTGLATDAAGRLYAMGSGETSIRIFAPDATGNDAPVATISGPSTGIQPVQIAGLALDTAGNIYLADYDRILVFAAGSTGDVAPVRTIAGAATTLTGARAAAIGVDSTGAITVVDILNRSVIIFASGASGDVAPLRTITAGLSSPWGLAVTSSDDVWVTDSGANALRRYSSAASGSTLLATISGAATQLASPRGIVVSPTTGDLYVSNFSSSSVTSYDSAADGAAEPLIRLTNSAITGPLPLAVDGYGNLSVANLNSSVAVFAIPNDVTPVTPVVPAGPALAATGLDATPATIAALGLLAAGAIALVVARRRRTSAAKNIAH